MKYYKGKIIGTKLHNTLNYNLDFAEIQNVHFKKASHYYILNSSSIKGYLFFNRYSFLDLKEIIMQLRKIVTNMATDEEKLKINELIAKIFYLTPENGHYSGIDIIYEKIYDEEGNSYGKELITGNIFLINTKYSSFDINYELKENDEKYFYDEESYKSYAIKKVYSSSQAKNLFYLVDLNDEKEIEIENSIDYYRLNCLSMNEQYYVDFKKKSVGLRPFYLQSYNILMTPKMTFPSDKRVENVIINEQIANEIEVEKYLNEFKGFYKNFRKKAFIKLINNKAQSNYLGDNLNFVNDILLKERISESNLTKEMQELEFLLYKLKTIAPNDYDILSHEYHDIINNENTQLNINPLSINTIVSLQNRARIAFFCHGGDSKRILEYLRNQTGIYLEKYKNQESCKTEISITDLDRLCTYFLNEKNNYSYKEQNEILKHLALLYFFEIYENRDIINSNDLINSYACDNIKRMLVIVGVLHEVGIIKNIPTNFYDISNMDEFLEYIRTIEINSCDIILEDTNFKLVKKLQQ